DIDGAGSLTKDGSGALTLSGDNSFTGGVVLAGGTLRAASATALGAGDVRIDGGTLAIAEPAQIAGTFSQGSGGSLSLTAAPETALQVDGPATLAGTLHLTVPEDTDLS